MIWYQVVGLAFCVSVIWRQVNAIIITTKREGTMMSAERVIAYLFITTIFLFFTLILAITIIASTYEIITN